MIWLCPDLSRRTKVLTSNQRKYLDFRNSTFPVFISKFLYFYKIICFTKQIYYFFITSSVLLSKFDIFVNNESFIAGSAGPSHKASEEEGTDKAELSDDNGSF